MTFRAGPLALALVVAASAAQAASPELECEVIKAIPGDLWTGDVLRESRAGLGAGLARELPNVAKALGLSEQEMERAQAAARADAAPYRPACWGPLIPPAFEGRYVTFSRPAFFASDGAIVHMTRDEHDRGWAGTCVVRRIDGVWTAACHQTMIWAH